MVTIMPVINLRDLTDNGRVQSLSGHERGLSARKQFDLDTLDSADEKITVCIPREIDAISPSFFQGLFSGSLLKSFNRNPELFFDHYSFDASAAVLAQVERGIAALLIRRPWA